MTLEHKKYVRLKIGKAELVPGAYLLNPLAYCSYQAFSELSKFQEELSQARKLIDELVKMGKFYADKNNYAGRRSKSDIFSNIIGDNTIYPDRTAFGGRYARDVLSNNKDIIEKLTKE